MVTEGTNSTVGVVGRTTGPNAGRIEWAVTSGINMTLGVGGEVPRTHTEEGEVAPGTNTILGVAGEAPAQVG